MPRQLVDSHVHLFELDHVHSLSWMTPTSPLYGQHSVAEYVTTTQQRSRLSESSKEGPRQLLGFIFVEADRIKNPPSKLEGWKYSLQEYSFAASISLGLIPEYVKYSSLFLGIIPWGPLPYGCVAMQQYERELCALHSEHIAVNGVERPYKVKGFRHLLQDEPRRTMLGARFLESLRWMGRRGYVFECTVDCRGSQLWQLEEVIEMMGRVNRQIARDEDLVQVVVSKIPPCCPELYVATFGGQNTLTNFTATSRSPTSTSTHHPVQNHTPTIRGIFRSSTSFLDSPMSR
jgi:L-rhamnono-1,4-lactonase